MIRFCGVLFVLVIAVIGRAQTASVSGQLMDMDGEPIPFANVLIEGTSQGASSNDDGVFTIQNLDAGHHVLKVSGVGYKLERIEVDLTDGETKELGVISVQEDMLGLQEVVVSATMRETFVKASPVKVDVIPLEHITRNLPATNVVEGLQLISGVQEVVACGVCFTNSISINGLPGPYTAVLMDGSPIYGSLASVYGLNGIPTQMIERVEVIRGPNSTLYGSEAIAGVINIITKDPQYQPLLALDIMGTSHAESFGNITFSPEVGKWKTMTGLNYAYMNRFDDSNNDGFGDIIQMDRVSFFSKWSRERKNSKRFDVAAKLYYEDRRNGVEQYLEDRNYQEIRGNDSIYGESIYTMRAELFGKYELQSSEDLRIDYSLSWHDQDSYYGADSYEAQQAVGFANLVWTKSAGKHSITSGLTNRYQFYDDNTIATGDSLSNAASHQYIPGVFVQDEWKVRPRWTLLAGMRMDHYNSHGFIPAPRLSTKFSVSEWTTLRANFGTGFRIVNLFAEDHAFVTGQREVIISESLNPEQSWNVSLNANHIFTIGNSQGSFDVDAFYTRFANKIQPDYDTPGQIIYANTDGHALTQGVNVSFNQQFKFPLSYNLGFSWIDATTTERNENGDFETSGIEYSPDWTAVVTVNYRLRKWNVDIAYTASLTGPMELPETYDLNEEGTPVGTARPTKSETFVFQNIQVTKPIRDDRLILYGGIQNAMNYSQEYSPLVGFNDPTSNPGFSPYFDTAYAYSPIHGREFYLGLRMSLGQR